MPSLARMVLPIKAPASPIYLGDRVNLGLIEFVEGSHLPKRMLEHQM